MSASESDKISAKISSSVRPSLLRRLSGGIGYYVPSILVLLGLVVFWQLAVDLFHVKEYILPSPLAALKALARPNYQWVNNFLATLYSVLGAFVLSAVLGIALAERHRRWRLSPAAEVLLKSR